MATSSPPDENQQLVKKNRIIANLKEDIQRLSSELKSQSELLTNTLDVAHEQSLQISSLKAALQDTVAWDRTSSPPQPSSSTPSRVSCEELTPVKNEEYSLEGSTVTLSYRYSKQATGGDYFFWYRQYPGKPPEFIMYHLGNGATVNQGIAGLTIKVDQNLINMNISSAAVTDSAVYYCALQPTVTGNTKTLYKNIMSKDNTILHNIH
ncbi:hypothetical protein ABVT39_016936 [Epinephelus coioides]